MTENVCESCSKPLEASSSIVFTPTDGDAKEKHLCMSCFENLDKSEPKHEAA